MSEKAAVLFHGDCDGVISAGLYIRHFLVDFMPSKILLRYTHPWRLVQDLKSVAKEKGARILVLVDLALTGSVVDILKSMLKSGVSVVVVDHHASSSRYINPLREAGAEVVWAHVQSTPRVIAEKLVRNLNSYEAMLVKMADACEGGNVDDVHVKEVADKVKLVLATGSADERVIRLAVEAIVKGEEFWNKTEFSEQFVRGRWLLQVLIRRMEERAKVLCGWALVPFSAAESIMYAGLFGVASSEYAKKHGVSLVLVREERGKIVVTVRSSTGRALELCEKVVERYGEGFMGSYGGHKEAASMTLHGSMGLEAVLSVLEGIIERDFCIKASRNVMSPRETRP